MPAPQSIPEPNLDSGVNWNRIAFEAPVIPAKAGIQSVGGTFPMACGRDSRFRGNDFAWGRPFLANDTTTRICNIFSATLSSSCGRIANRRILRPPWQGQEKHEWHTNPDRAPSAAGVFLRLRAARSRQLR